MKKFYFLISLFVSTLFASAQDVVVCNFDNLWPATEVTAFGVIPHDYWKTSAGVAPGIVADPTDQGNMVAYVEISKELSATQGGGIAFKMTPNVYNSSNFSAVSFRIKSSYDYAFRFFQVLERNPGGKGNQWGNWGSMIPYTGGGAWQTVTVPLNATQKENHDFDMVTINLVCNTAETPISVLKFYLDDIKLVRSATEVKSPTVDDERNIIFRNGSLFVKNINMATKVKMYSVTGTLIYESVQESDFSVNLFDKGLSSGVLLVNLNDGVTQITKKIILQ